MSARSRIALLQWAAGCHLLAAGVALAASADPSSPDLGWNQWRGPTHNGVAPSQKWSWKWPKDGPRKLWDANVGMGYACPIVSNGRVFAFGLFSNDASGWSPRARSKRAEHPDLKGDYVTCFDAETGKMFWRTKVGEGSISDNGSTPCTDGNLVFSVTADGNVTALDAVTGKEVWQVKDIIKQYSLEVERYHGFLNPPLLVENVLVLAQGLGFDKNTGKFLWQNKDGWVQTKGLQDHYQSPVCCRAGETAGVLLFGKSMMLVDPSSGKTLWQCDQTRRLGRIYPDPIVLGDRILYMSHNNANRFKFTATSVTDDSAGMNKKSGAGDFSNPVVWDGHVYSVETGGDDSGMFGIGCGSYETVLECFDLGDLKRRWVQNGFSGSPIVCDGKLILQGTSGNIHVIDASAEGFKLLAKARIFDLRGKDPKYPFGTGNWRDGSFCQPALVNGRMYLHHTDGDFCCLDVRNDYPDAVTDVNSNKLPGEVMTVTGVLGKKPDNAPDYVAGTLTEEARAGGKSGDVKRTYTLCTKSGAKRQIVAAMGEKRASVTVTGTLLYDDNMSVNVVGDGDASNKTTAK